MRKIASLSDMEWSYPRGLESIRNLLQVKPNFRWVSDKGIFTQLFITQKAQNLELHETSQL